MNVKCSRACAISEDTSHVLVTGGENTLKTVSRYNGFFGWVEDLGELLVGRYGHACGSYLDSNDEKVDEVWKKNVN